MGANTKAGDFRMRILYAFAAAVVICLGLLWRSPFLGLPAFVSKYGGDALWSLLVFLCIRICLPQRPHWIPSLIAFTIACAVEFSQLYHSTWIDSIRSTLAGRLILGSTFNWPDIPAYALGNLLGFIPDRVIQRRS